MPVTLTMPPSGYVARAFVTNPCGGPVRGAYVTVTGRIARPHGLPHGTSYVDWEVTAAKPAAHGGRIGLILASKQTIGKATTCRSGRSPYAGHSHAAAAGRLVSGWQPPGSSSSNTALVGALGGAVVLLAVACLLLWRRARRQAR